MWFKEVSVENFGKLTGSWTFKPKCLNLILAPNESGKTSLTNAIVATLYSKIPKLYFNRKSDKWHFKWEEPDKIYTNWTNSGLMNIKLSMSIDQDQYDIRKKINPSNKSARVEFQFLVNGISKAADLIQSDKDIGEFLFNMSQEQFMAIVLASQRQVELVSRGSLVDLLESVATSKQVGITANEALDSLNRALHPYPQAVNKHGKPRQISTSGYLNELQKRITEINNVLSKLESERSIQLEKIQAIQKLKIQSDQLTHETKTLQLALYVAEKNDIEKQLLLYNQSQTKLTQLEQYLDFPADNASTIYKNKGAIDSIQRQLNETKMDIEQLHSQLEKLEQEAADINPRLKTMPLEKLGTCNHLAVELQSKSSETAIYSEQISQQSLGELERLINIFGVKGPTIKDVTLNEDYDEVTEDIQVVKNDILLSEKSKKRFVTILSTGIICLLIGTGFGWVSSNWIIGGIVALSGLILLTFSLGLRSSIRNKGELKKTYSTLMEKLSILEEAIASSTTLVQFHSKDDFKTSIKSWQSILTEPAVPLLLKSREQHDQIKGKLVDLLDLTKIGDIDMTVPGFIKMIKAAKTWKENADEINRKLIDKKRSLSRFNEDFKSKQDLIDKTLQGSKITGYASIAEGIEFFNTALRKATEAKNIKSMIIPQEQVEPLQKQLNVCTVEIEKLSEDNIESDEDLVNKDLNWLRNKYSEIEQKRQLIITEINQFEKDIIVAETEYANKSFELEEKLLQIQIEYKRADLYAQSIKLAMDMLHEESQQVFIQWGNDLQEILDGYVKHMGHQ